MDVLIRPLGERAVLCEVADQGQVGALHTVLSAATLPGVTELLPAATTLLVRVAKPALRDELGEHIANLAAHLDPAEILHFDDAEEVEAIEIKVKYDGEDLDDVAKHTGLSTREVIHAHTETPWRVGFFGFAPGFAYLVDGDPRLSVPRRAEPRTRVPTGSVGLAGEFSAIYPRTSPGGWQVIGTTQTQMWDTGREPPALLKPQAIVRFVGTRR